MSDDRAVSEVIGFVIVFSLITASVGIVSVAGFDALDDARSEAQMENRLRSYEVLAHNTEDVFQRGAPSRTTEIRLSGSGQIAAGEPVDITVDITRNPPGAVTASESFTYRPLVYRSDDAVRVVFSNGAVFRQRQGTAQVARRPSFGLPTSAGGYDRSTLVFVRSDVLDDAVGGQQTVQVRTVQQSQRRIIVDQANEHRIRLRIDTDERRAEAWARWTKESLPEGIPASCSVSGGVADCAYNVGGNNSQISAHLVSVEFEVL